jgi:hypothetical protein
MAQIPGMINGVAVQFSPTVVNDVAQWVIEGLKHCVNTNIAPGATLTTVYVSSAYDSHTLPSRHMQHKAVDLSRINGLLIGNAYPSNSSVKAIVDAIQTAFEAYPHRRENFGPFLKKKLGQNFVIAGHKDHIHLSVN